jgi:hypothetical protein
LAAAAGPASRRSRCRRTQIAVPAISAANVTPPGPRAQGPLGDAPAAVALEFVVDSRRTTKTSRSAHPNPPPDVKAAPSTANRPPATSPVISPIASQEAVHSAEIV